MPIVFTDAQFGQLLERVTALRESASAADTETDMAAAIDPVSASTLQKLRAGTPVHQLAADENEAVRLAWIRSQHVGYFARGRRT